MGRENMSSWVAVIIGVVGSVLAYIFQLRSKTQSLQSKVGMLEGESKIRAELTKAEDAQKEASSEEDKYRALRDEFNKPDDESGGPVH